MRTRLWGITLAAGLTLGCQPTPSLPGAGAATSVPAAVRAAAPDLAPRPVARVRQILDTSGGGSLTGMVAFSVVTDSRFAENAAQRRVLDLPSAHALVSLSTLEGDGLAFQGAPIDATTRLDGTFELLGSVPTDGPIVVNALLAQSHLLTAIAVPGMAAVRLDEASSLVTEMARWQLRTRPEATAPAGAKSLLDLGAEALEALTADTRTFLTAAMFAAGGDDDGIAALRAGAGDQMRNLYVAAFGRHVSADGDTPANRLSDRWAGLLGYQPLAITRVVGNGFNGYNQADGRPALEIPMSEPMSAVADAGGNLYLTMQSGGLLGFIPAEDRETGPFGEAKTMKAGHFYTIGGVVNGPTGPEFEAFHRAIEKASNTDAPMGPLLSQPGGYPLARPARLLAVPAVGGSDMYISSVLGKRVFFVPATDKQAYGRQFLAGRLYTLVGRGDDKWGEALVADDPETPYDDAVYRYLLGDGQLGYEASLQAPTGIAHDAAGNLFVLDSELYTHDAPGGDPEATISQSGANGLERHSYHGTMRVLRASDGRVFSLRPVVGGVPAPLVGARDLCISPDGAFLYLADTARHRVLRTPLTGVLDQLSVATPRVDVEMELVLGVTDRPGFVNLDVSGAAYPQVFDVGRAVPRAHVLLNGPTSIVFDAEGHLLVADGGRIRALDADTPDGLVYTLAGGFQTPYLEGDARLATFPGTAYLSVEPATGNILLPDRRENIVRRLHTARGIF